MKFQVTQRVVFDREELQVPFIASLLVDWLTQLRESEQYDPKWGNLEAFKHDITSYIAVFEKLASGYPLGIFDDQTLSDFMNDFKSYALYVV